MTEGSPSTAEVLFQIGELKGQMTALVSLVAQKREDINTIYSRLSILEKTSASTEQLAVIDKRLTSLEKEIAKWFGIGLAIAFVFSLAMPQIQRSLGIVTRDTIQDAQGIERDLQKKP